MKLSKIIILLILITISFALHASKPFNIAIISSYHPEYIWTKETGEGVLKALYETNYLTTPQEAEEFTRNNYLANDKVILKKWWMDSKRKNTLPEIQRETTKIIQKLNAFSPDIVLTGDDNATNYLGNYYIDSKTPLVFWGVNGNPMKYGLLDSLEHPGHNITGVYQADYLKESIVFFKNLLPEIKTITILSDDSVSSRARVKKIHSLSSLGKLPLKIVGSITTNSYSDWQKETLEAEKYTDSFFMLNHNTLKDESGKPVNEMEAGAWYLRNIKKPEVSNEQHFIVEGMLAAVSDSGLKQGYQAMMIAIKILHGGRASEIAVSAPSRGNYVVNKERAKTLNLYDKIKDDTQIEAWIDDSMALKRYPR
jgi:putative tryptophan/tyrosine transport system substrate-binding protein